MISFGVLYFRKRTGGDVLKKMLIAAGGRRGRSRGPRAVEGAALEDQAAARISDFRVGRRRGQRAIARPEPGRHRVRRHLERRQRIRAARREQGRQGRPRHHRHQRPAEHAQRRRLPRRRAVCRRDQPRRSLRQHRVEARERRNAGRRHRQASERSASRLEVHPVRP